MAKIVEESRLRPLTKPLSLPSWDELCAHTARKARTPEGRAFLAEVEELKTAPPRFGYRVARKVVTTLLRDPFYQKFLTCTLGDIVDMLADQVVRNQEIEKDASTLPTSAPLSDRAGTRIFRPYNQMPCTRGTAVRRVAKALELAQKDDPILLLGDDDLVSVELAAAGFTKVTAVDIDAKVLTEIEKLCKEQDLNVRRVEQDLSKPLPLSLYDDYKLVAFDPCYTIPSVQLFLDAGLELSRRSSGTHFFLSLHTMSLMRHGLPEFSQALSARGLDLVEFHQGFNAYPAPSRLKSLIHLVNKIVIGSKTLATEGHGFPFFLSDALLLRKA